MGGLRVGELLLRGRDDLVGSGCAPPSACCAQGRLLSSYSPVKSRTPTGTTPSASTKSASLKPTATTRVGAAGIVVLPNACVIVTGNAADGCWAAGVGLVVAVPQAVVPNASTAAVTTPQVRHARRRAAASRLPHPAPGGLVRRAGERTVVSGGWSLVGTQNEKLNIMTDAPAPGHIEFLHRSWPADAEQLAVIRHELAGWLAPLRLTDNETADVVLAVDEAASNAVSHAYGPDRSGVVELTLWTEGGTLSIEVVDHGHWRAPDPEPHPARGGRGIALMNVMSESVLIRYDDRGSRVLLRHRIPLDPADDQA
ncbi:ATP-binding protein [Pseudonocardia sp.]|uniref:ATP-binding protein n=2 Tax=unclassified Pseudonocardia TaxID=2619320 RepID=UPI0025CE3E4E|nr:ATP-binding protein [Pseudonocardia sp.]